MWEKYEDMRSLQIFDAFDFGWQYMKKSGVILSMFVLFVGLLSTGILYWSLPQDLYDQYFQAIQSGDKASLQRVQELIMGKMGVILLASLIQTLLYVVAAAVAYQVCRENRKITFGDFLSLDIPVLRLITLVVLFMLIFSIGWIMFFIPGIYVAIRFSQCFYVMIDRPETGVMEALGRSWYMTQGNFWRLLCFACLCLLLIMVGYFFFIIGMFFSLAFCIFASVDVYRQLKLDY